METLVSFLVILLFVMMAAAAITLKISVTVMTSYLNSPRKTEEFLKRIIKGFKGKAV